MYSSPGPSAPREICTEPRGTGALAYLMLQGPCDGTQFARLVDEDDPQIREAIDDRIMKEMTVEEKRTEEFLDDRGPDEFPWTLSTAPPKDSVRAADFAREKARSTYHNEDGSWRRADLLRVIVAGFDITEVADYAGRWAGDEVRIVGDYDESGLYQESRPSMTIDVMDRDLTVTVDHLRSPVVEDSWNRPGIVCSHHNKALEVGDYTTVRSGDHENLESNTYGIVTDIDHGGWDDITDGLLEEFESFVGSEWYDSQEGVLAPDMVVGMSDD